MNTVQKRGKKKCSTCTQWKAFDAFSVRSKAPDGLQYSCRSCMKKYNDDLRNQRKGQGNAPIEIAATIPVAPTPQPVASTTRQSAIIQLSEKLTEEKEQTASLRKQLETLNEEIAKLRKVNHDLAYEVGVRDMEIEELKGNLNSLQGELSTSTTFSDEEKAHLSLHGIPIAC